MRRSSVRVRALAGAGVAALCASIAGAAPEASMRLEASMPDERLEVGREYSIRIDTSLTTGWSASNAGIPKAILQLDVPDSVDLSGRKLTGRRDLARNEYLQEPWERLIEIGETEVKFTLVDAPPPGETIGINVVAYVAAPDGDDAVFLRRRVDLPLKRGAGAWTDERAARSDWGINGTLQIGEPAADFSLPRADGSRISLNDHLGEKNILITTYRAFW